MTVLVTGGAGFIGSNFILYLMDKHPDWTIKCVDLLTYAADMDNLNDCWGKNDFGVFVKDICDKDEMANLFDIVKPDIVIHFAAESHVDNSINGPEIFMKTNLMGTQVLLEECRKHNVKRFHYVSTDEVYGDLPLDRPDLLFTEESNIKPSSPYSVSKAAGDLLTLAYGRTYGLPVSVSRCSNNYGPRQHEEKLIPHMIKKAINGERLPVYGNGLNVRDWLHVWDHCSAIDMIIHNDATIGEVYNVGGNNEIMNIAIVEMLCDILNKPYDIIEYVADRPGHDLRYAIDSSKLQALGWKPQMDFHDGMLDTVEWYVKKYAGLEV